MCTTNTHTHILVKKTERFKCGNVKMVFLVSKRSAITPRIRCIRFRPLKICAHIATPFKGNEFGVFIIVLVADWPD